VRAIHFPRLHLWNATLRLAGVRSFVTTVLSRSHERRAYRRLSDLDGHLLRDIGLERALVVLAAEVGPERVCAKPSERDQI